jgi:hypothetical protein
MYPMNRSVASVIAGSEIAGAPGGQKAQMDVAELTPDTSFRLTD